MDVDEEVEAPEPNAEHPPTINAVAEPSTDPLENNDNEEIAELNEVPSGRRSSEDSSTPAPKKRRGSNSNAAVLEILEKSSAERQKLLHAITTTAQQDTDSISLFFRSMAETVKTFQPQFILEAKAAVFKIINEIEIKSLQPATDCVLGWIEKTFFFYIEF